MEEEKDKNQQKIVEQINDSPVDDGEDFQHEKSKEEADFQAFQENRLKKKKIAKIKMASIGLIIFTIFVGLFIFFKDKFMPAGSSVQSEVALKVPENVESAVVTDGIVTDTSTSKQAKTVADAVVASDQDETAGVSEHYRIKNVSIGGGSNVVLSNISEGLTLAITDVHSETLMSRDGKKTKLLISWKTNKLAKSEIKYSKNGNGAEKNIKEDGYGFSHALILNDLEQSTRYVFGVSANDRSGKVVSSDALAVFTGAKPVSVFDLISNQMGDIFGWALK
ncbi:MAG: hypothetical protein WCI36_05555 [bacterium]